jgi:hypothetical protein
MYLDIDWIDEDKVGIYTGIKKWFKIRQIFRQQTNESGKF